jgi:hypothetical protein
MIRYLGLATPSCLFSYFPGLGIITLLVSLNTNFPDLRSWDICWNHFSLIPSKVSEVIPRDKFPAFYRVIAGP